MGSSGRSGAGRQWKSSDFTVREAAIGRKAVLCSPFGLVMAFLVKFDKGKGMEKKLFAELNLSDSMLKAVQAMGLQMSEAWHTAYGDAPNRLIGFVTDNEENMLNVLKNDTWLELNEQLEEYVSEFSYKVIPYRGGFQI